MTAQIVGLRDVLDMAGLDAGSKDDRKRLTDWLNRNAVPYIRIGRDVRGKGSGVLIDGEALVKAMHLRAAAKARKVKKPRKTKAQAAMEMP